MVSRPPRILSSAPIAERFEIIRLAGSGGMGAVYQATDLTTGEMVALKVLESGPGEGAKRFAREAEVLAALRHPRVVRYVAHGIAATGEPYLAMQWLEGESLSERLSREGLTLPESLALARRVAEALRYAHEKGVIHRDLKPSNLFLVDRSIERVTLLDFGIARHEGAKRELTTTGAMLGTPAYMSPEQARGEEPIDARTDVYSLGCVLFKCLTGRTPFVADDALSLLLKTVMDEPPRASELNPEVPPELDALCARMLSKSPDDRPKSAAAVASELDALGALPIGQKAPASAAPASLTTTERRLLCMVLAQTWQSYGTSTEVTWQSADAAREQKLRAMVERYRARLDVLADSTLLVTLAGRGSPLDLALQAARCAMDLQAHLGGAPVALVAGRAVLSPASPVGELIDRGARLLATPSGSGVRVDKATSQLLGERFFVSDDDGELSLLGERDRDLDGVARTLLGKPTACEGRDQELVMLEAMFDACESGPAARAALVTAAAGVGKSRLRSELVQKLRRREEAPQIWIGQGDPMRAGAPYATLASALAPALAFARGDAPEALYEKLKARLAGSFADDDLSRVAELMCEMLGAKLPDERNRRLRAAREDPVLMADLICRAWEDFVSAECTRGPVVIVLEDLHWGDRPSVNLIDAALRNLSDRPLMVLALAHREVRDVFPDLWAEREVAEIRLSGLSKRAAEKIVKRALGASTPPSVVADVIDRAAGNAFFLEELIRGVAEGEGGALPATVLAMVEARLARLDAAARLALRAASVFGTTFWAGGVGALLGERKAAPELDAVLRDLVARELVTRRGDGKARLAGEDEYVFRNAATREAAYAMLTEEDRSLGHRLAGAWLERAGEDQAAVLADHFERGGDAARAIGWYQRATAQSLAASDLEQAIARADRGAALGASGEALGELRLGQAEARLARGENAEAYRAAKEALSLLSKKSPRYMTAAADAVIASARLGLHEETVALAAEIDALTSDAELSGAQAISAARVAIQLMFGGRREAADALLGKFHRAARAAAAEGPGVAGWIQQARAWHALFEGDPAAYLVLSMAAQEAFREAGNERGATTARVNVAYACMQMGDYAQAASALTAVTQTQTRMGLSTAVAQHNLGLALAYLGRWDEALDAEQTAVDAFVTRTDRRMEGGGRLYLALILAMASKLGDAEREAARALEIAEGSGPIVAYGRATLAYVRLLKGDAMGAWAEADRAMAELTALGGVDEGDAFIRLVHAEALEAGGALEEAAAFAEKARARLLERAGKIQDASWRESFLTRVPENARTLALAARLCGA